MNGMARTKTSQAEAVLPPPARKSPAATSSARARLRPTKRPPMVYSDDARPRRRALP
jgi:hypothetical protein